jgi:hypothetical protein
MTAQTQWYSIDELLQHDHFADAGRAIDAFLISEDISWANLYDAHENVDDVREELEKSEKACAELEDKCDALEELIQSLRYTLDDLDALSEEDLGIEGKAQVDGALSAIVNNEHLGDWRWQT